MNKNTQKVMFSKGKDDWETPQEFFDLLNKEFNFTLDAAASHTNHKCPKYYTEEDDSLVQDWTGEVVFLNPPYSQNKAFLKKCFEEARKAKTIVVLIPVRASTVFWHDYCMKADEIRFVKGRLKFSGQKNSAPFPSAVIIFKNEEKYAFGDYPKVKTMRRK